MIRILYKNQEGLRCAAVEFLHFSEVTVDGERVDHVWFTYDGLLVEIEVDEQFLDDTFTFALKCGFLDLSDCDLLSEVVID